MKTPCFLAACLTLASSLNLAFGANILWVSDAPPAGFSGPGTSFTDQGFVTLLQNAGHNVNRFNGPDANATLLTDAEMAAMNTNDLVIIGRAAGSGAWQAPQGVQWNTNISKPLICMSPYLVRTLASGTRMGWFTGGGLPDDTTTKVKAVDVTDAKTDFLLGGIAMIGDTSVELFDELLDRNTSHISDAPVAGGRRLITGTYIQEDNGATVTASIVAEFPAGTPVTGGNLAGYRMYLSGGSRESGVAPNAIPLYTGRENLTPSGERLFLRAIQLALNNGVPPTVDPSTPVAIVSDPVGATVSQGSSVTFTAEVSGAAPRTVQWQRDTGGDGVYVDIPGAITTFSSSSYTLSAADTLDNGAHFRVVASNPNNAVQSAPATLLVTPDTAPPAILGAGSLDGNTVTVTFNELLDDVTAEDEFNYELIGLDGLQVSDATLRQDRKSVVLTLSGPVAATFRLKVINVQDRLLNGISEDPGVVVDGVSLGLTSAVVGALNPAGSAAAVGIAGTFEVTGGGLDLGSTADQMQFVSKSAEGDFDARVRVLSIITGSNRIESVTKAILSARATAETGSAAVNVFATIGYPGDNIIASSVRAAAGGATNTLGTPFSPVNLPNTWLRIRRVGDVFTTMRSANGIDWSTIGSTSLALGSPILVGAGVASHRNGWPAIATFSEFQVSRIINPPRLTGLAYNGTTFTGSIPTQAGITYLIQYKDNLTDANWTSVATLTGDGTAQPFSDTTANVPNRFYRAVANP